MLDLFGFLAVLVWALVLVPGVVLGTLRQKHPCALAERDQARAEAARLRVLAERAYPGLKPSAVCSRCRPAGPPPFDCTVCYPDPNALIAAHLKARERLREQVQRERRAVDPAAGV